MALKVSVLLGALLWAGIAPATAQEMSPPRFSVAPVDWDAALASLDKIEAAKAEPPGAPDELAERPTPDPIVPLLRLNRAAAQNFPNIAASPVPVLLPFDIAGYLREKVAETSVADSTRYFSGFHPSHFFQAGPPGYDAAFMIKPSELPALAIDHTDEVEVQITGAAQLYELAPAAGTVDKPINGLAADFPGLRRIYLESHMRYIFVRYGVTYSVSILCFDGHAPRKWLSCRDADSIANRFLTALRLVGGLPHPQPAQPQLALAPRPEEPSSVFGYYPPGRLAPRSGFRSHDGESDTTVFAEIRFPLQTAPAQVYSQVFINPGDCTQTSTSGGTIRRGGRPFHCNTSDKLPDGDGTKTFAYPWRDNFCESRSFSVGQCPGGSGHQGEDIVPAECAFGGEPAQRCDADRTEVVAVHGGTVMRMAGQEGFVIAVNAANTHMRFRYLHMNPKMLDAAGFVNGRAVTAGEPIGTVGNYNGHNAGTSYHVHFDMQVFTRDGWVLVSPYATLIAGYERLIGQRGQVLRDPEVVAEAPAAPAVTAPAATHHVAGARAGRTHHARKRDFARGGHRLRHRFARR